MTFDFIDHLVYAAPDLQRGIDAFADLTGVVATPGGQHPGRGTRNALVSLGPRRYLEIIAPDPDQPAPMAPRWLGVDSVTEPRLTTWAAHGNDLTALVQHARTAGVPLGGVRDGARTRADGVRLSWTLTDAAPMLMDGVIPFFIDWGTSPHPSEMAAGGITLLELHIEHPDAPRVRQMFELLGMPVVVQQADVASLVAVLQTPRGRVEVR